MSLLILTEVRFVRAGLVLAAGFCKAWFFFSFHARQRSDGSIHVREGFVAVQRLCGGCSPCFFPSNCCAAPNASVAEQCARAALRFGKRVSIVMFFT